jgi:hypothetical protein
MQRHLFAMLAIAMSVATIVGVNGQGVQPLSIRIEGMYPRFAPRGRATVINVAVPSAEAVRAAEITPATGVTVSAIQGSGSGSEQNVGWWEVTLDVSSDAAPGDRALVLVLPGARTMPATFTVSSHAPAISDLKIGPASNQSSLELQLAVSDTSGDLGDSPYVWFTADCGGDPIVGALKAKVSGGVARTTLPNVRTAAHDGIPEIGKCGLRVRLTDSTGIESNTLTTTVEFQK